MSAVNSGCSGQSPFIGLHSAGSGRTNSEWRWASDNLQIWQGLTPSQGGHAINGAYTQWHGTGEPNGGNTVEECVQFYSVRHRPSV